MLPNSLAKSWLSGLLKKLTQRSPALNFGDRRFVGAARRSGRVVSSENPKNAECVAGNSPPWSTKCGALFPGGLAWLWHLQSEPGTETFKYNPVRSCVCPSPSLSSADLSIRFRMREITSILQTARVSLTCTPGRKGVKALPGGRRGLFIADAACCSG